MNLAQAQVHFSMWCITSSPLILGNDVRNMSAADLSVVSNTAAIKVNQGWAGTFKCLCVSASFLRSSFLPFFFSFLPPPSSTPPPLPPHLLFIVCGAILQMPQHSKGFAGDMLNYTQYPPVNASRHNTTNVPAQSVWWKPLPNRTAAVVLLNSKGGTANVSLRFDELQYGGVAALASGKNCNVHSIWDDKTLGTFNGGFSADVEGSTCIFAIISGCE